MMAPEYMRFEPKKTRRRFARLELCLGKAKARNVKATDRVLASIRGLATQGPGWEATLHEACASRQEFTACEAAWINFLLSVEPPPRKISLCELTHRELGAILRPWERGRKAAFQLATRFGRPDGQPDYWSVGKAACDIRSQAMKELLRRREARKEAWFSSAEAQVVGVLA